MKQIMKINRKMRHTCFAIAVAFCATVGIVACADTFLDEELYSSYGTGLSDKQSVEAQVIGLHRIYAELWGWSSRQGFLGCWQVGTDVGSPGATEGVENPFYQYADLNSENGGVSWMWEKCYDFINNANIIVKVAEEQDYKELAAEAKFFRAYAYNTLVTLWGDVPLIKEAVTTPRTDLTRQPVAEVDAFIEEDLTYAIANLPEVGSAAKPSRANKDMAHQLAAEAYLRMGVRTSSYFAKAEAEATAIIGGGNYSLVEARYGAPRVSSSTGGDYYSDIFKWGKQRRSEGNTETIWTFEMEYNRDVTGGTIDNPQHRRVWQPALHKWGEMVNADSLGGRGNGRLRLSNFMKYTVWAGLEGDIRNSNYNIRRYTYYNKPGVSVEIGIDAKGFRVAKDAGVSNVTITTGSRTIPMEGDSLEIWYPHPTKWGAYDETDDFGYALIKDWQIMRLGETYLLRAEARLRQNNTSGAADDINTLRNRAFKAYRAGGGAANAGAVTAGDITIDFILDERARELIGEENRRLTLARMGDKDLFASRVAKNGDAIPGAPEGKVITGFDKAKHTLLPIPLAEIQLNKDAVLTQNPLYD
jgi:hypothetical protein